MKQSEVTSPDRSAPQLRELMAAFVQVAGSRAPLYARFAAILAESMALSLSLRPHCGAAPRSAVRQQR